jgi:hypothetical protein
MLALKASTLAKQTWMSSDVVTANAFLGCQRATPENFIERKRLPCQGIISLVVTHVNLTFEGACNPSLGHNAGCTTGALTDVWWADGCAEHRVI